MAVRDPEPACRACGSPVTSRAPNVLIARAERPSLDERHSRAEQGACASGCEAQFRRAAELAEGSAAVVNIPVGFALQFLTTDRSFFIPYIVQVEGGVRAPAALNDEKRRQIADIFLYGSYSREVSFGALAPDGRGLTSYGEVHLELDPATIDFRTTVLDENSFHFHEKCRDGYEPGHLASWEDRGRLAAVKLTETLDATMDDAALKALIIQGSGDRATDQMLEAHIYGRFNSEAVTVVRMPTAFELEEDQWVADAVRARIVTGIRIEDV